MNLEIKIRDKVIGEGRPLFIIAETGVTCNYDLGITKQLIDVVRDAGADAIKFIFWFPEEIMSDKKISYEYQTVEGYRTENMYEMLSKLTFTLEEWVEIKRYAEGHGVIMFSTVNSPSGIDYAEKLGLEAYKLSSWDYNYTPLWKRIAKLGKPMIIDTGPVNTLEVARVIQLMKDARNEQSIFLHCPHAENYEEINIRSIPYLRKSFNTLVGFSSKGQESETDIMAVSLGAVVLEKRLTLSRSLPGHHHVLSLEPEEFKSYVQLLRNVQKAGGVWDLLPSSVDLAERKKWFRHLVANRDLKKGTTLERGMLEGKRPDNGISPEFLDLFLNRPLKRDLTYNEAIRWDDV